MQKILGTSFFFSILLLFKKELRSAAAHGAHCFPCKFEKKMNIFKNWLFHTFSFKNWLFFTFSRIAALRARAHHFVSTSMSKCTKSEMGKRCSRWMFSKSSRVIPVERVISSHLQADRRGNGSSNSTLGVKIERESFRRVNSTWKESKWS